jgi:hypothetical protein
MPTSEQNIRTMDAQHTELRVRAAIQANTINEDDRTVEVVFGSEQPVPFYMNYERALEILSFDPAHVRLDFMNRGAHFLDNHQRWGSVADCVLGAVVSARTDGRQGICRVKFATDEPAERCWKRVKERTLNWLSVGYKVYKYMEELGSDTLPLYRAIDWEPMEVSLVPVPADTSAAVRAAAGGTQQEPATPVISRVTIISNIQNRAMEEHVDPGTGQAAAPPAATPPPTAPPPAPDGQRSTPPAAEATATPPANHALAIMQAVRAANLDMAFAETLISENVTPEVARERCIAEWATRQQQNTPPIFGANGAVTRDDGRERQMQDIETALAHRLKPSVPVTDGARQYSGMRMMEVFREFCRQRNVPLAGYSQRQVAEMALGLRGAGGMHSTSDFPLILGNTVNRSLREAYELQGRSWLPFSQRATAADFREMTAVQLGEASGFDKVNEGGEYKRGTTSEAAEKYRVAKYGKIYPFTWEMLINDDLNAFSRMPRLIAAQAVQKQNDLVWDMLLGNSGNGQVMADNQPLFHSTHNNVAASGTALSVDSLAAARAAMRKHKALDGKSFVDVTPRFLVVGPDQELKAFQFTSTNYVPAKSADINVSYITSLQVIVDPRITDNRWFLIAAPGAYDTLEYAFLDGEGELFTETRYGFDVDGMEIKARMVFGAKVLEYRSFYKNAGA